MAKQVRMMVLRDCPHCHKAKEMMKELEAQHPEYKDVEFEIVDEQEHPEIAATLDYWYVPTYYVDGKKLHEGVPTLEAVENVYKEALA